MPDLRDICNDELVRLALRQIADALTNREISIPRYRVQSIINILTVHRFIGAGEEKPRLRRLDPSEVKRNSAKACATWRKANPDKWRAIQKRARAKRKAKRLEMGYV